MFAAEHDGKLPGANGESKRFWRHLRQQPTRNGKFVIAAGEMAYVYGSVRWKMPNEAEQQGKYISVWIKTDCERKNAVEMRNSNSY